MEPSGAWRRFSRLDLRAERGPRRRRGKLLGWALGPGQHQAPGWAPAAELAESPIGFPPADRPQYFLPLRPCTHFLFPSLGKKKKIGVIEPNIEYWKLLILSFCFLDFGEKSERILSLLCNIYCGTSINILSPFALFNSVYSLKKLKVIK